MQRIMIVGSSGAGKSTLSHLLAEKLSLPIIHLDQAYWQAGWEETPKEEWRGKVGQLVLQQRWIMDGNYGGTMDLRLPLADLVIWLDYSRWICLWRAIKRTIYYWGRSRPDMPQACPEGWDWEFMKYIYQFPDKHRGRLLAHLETSPPPQLLQFSRPKELNNWLWERFN